MSVRQRKKAQELLRTHRVSCKSASVRNSFYSKKSLSAMIRTTRARRLIGLLLIAAMFSGCIQLHHRTIREYRTDQGGRTTMSNVTEEEYWKERVDERIAAEIAHEKPEAGYDTWQNYWRWWYSVLRRKKKAPFKSDQFKTSEDLVNYIKERRREKGLPIYED